MTTIQNFDTCIIGLGPAGLGAALCLARSRVARNVVCLEAGTAPDVKFCSILRGQGCRRVQPCQMITGVGGASLLAGGKISEFPAGRAMSGIIGNDTDTREHLESALAKFQRYIPVISSKVFQKEIDAASTEYSRLGFEFRYYNAHLYRQKDLIAGYGRMLDEICSAGLTVKLNTAVREINTSEQGFCISAIDSGRHVDFVSRRVILATGRYGMDLISSVDSKLGLGKKPNHCELGVRLEFPCSEWPDIDRCHNDLKLQFGRARTFCVCKHGVIAPYRLENSFLLEGHSDLDTASEFTNLGISLRLELSQEFDEWDLFQDVSRRLNKQTDGIPIRQRLLDYLAERPSKSNSVIEPSSISYWRWGNANECFPEDIAKAIRESVRYFVSRILPQDSHNRISVYAPQMDYYWPRLEVREGFESTKSGMYLIGDCSGHFRGILQAFCSGIVCAEHILGGINGS